jgi:hypothetical protein
MKLVIDPERNTTNSAMVYRASLLIVLGLVGVGLIFNAAAYSQGDAVSASVTLPALEPMGDYQSTNPAPLELGEVRALTYDDALAKLHPGQWFGWADPENKTYENLIVHDGRYSKPSKALLDSLVDSATSTRANNRAAKQSREANRITLETSIANGNAGLADIRAYLRLLGDF